MIPLSLSATKAVWLLNFSPQLVYFDSSLFLEFLIKNSTITLYAK